MFPDSVGQVEGHSLKKINNDNGTNNERQVRSVPVRRIINIPIESSLTNLFPMQVKKQNSQRRKKYQEENLIF